MSRADRSAVRYRELLRDREFAALFIADTASRTGSHLGKFALAALVYHRTGSLSATSATFAVTYLPGIVAGPVLSTLADRLPRKPLLVCCDLLRAALVAGIAFAEPPIWSALSMLLLVELIKVPFGAARIALLADILSGDRLAAGTALVAASQQAVQIVGFGLGGLVVAGLGPRPALIIDTASYVVSALVLATLIRRRPAPDAAGRENGTCGDAVERAGGNQDGREQEVREQDSGKPKGPGRRLRPLRDTAEGIRVVCRTGRLPTLFWLLALGPTVLATAEGLAIPYAAALGAEEVAGLVLAAVPLGTVIGLAFVGKLSHRGRERVLIPFSLAVGLCVAVAGLVPIPAVVCLGLFAAGVAMGHFAHVQASIVGLVAPEVRGRVVGLANTALSLGQGVAALLAGVVADLYSIGAVLVFGGVGATTGVLILSVVGAPYAGRHRADPRRLRRERRRSRRIRTARPVPAVPGSPLPASVRATGPLVPGARPAPPTFPWSPPPALAQWHHATPGTAGYPTPFAGGAAPARQAGPPVGLAARSRPPAGTVRTGFEGRPADPLARPGAPRNPMQIPRP